MNAMRLFGHPLNVTALVGLAIILVNLVAVLFAPWIAPYTQSDTVGDVWAPVSASAVLGLDNLGRDMFSRMIYGARLSVTMALIATVLSYLIGCTLGFMAGPSQSTFWPVRTARLPSRTVSVKGPE